VRTDEARATLVAQAEQLDENADTGPPLGGIEYVGGEFSHCLSVS
jgi:hypothetical protein